MNPNCDPKSVLVVEDHPMVLEYLRNIVDQVDGVRWAGGCCRLSEAREMMSSSSPPDIVLVDLVLPGESGWRILNGDVSFRNRTKYVFMSGYFRDRFLLNLNHPAVLGFIHKSDATAEDWKHAFEAFSQLQKYQSPSIRERILRVKRDPNHWTKLLTKKEVELLPHFAQGGDNTEIATVVSLSEGTIHSHRRNVMRKLDLHSRVHLANWASARGFLSRGYSEEYSNKRVEPV